MSKTIKPTKTPAIHDSEAIEQKIYFIRGRKVMLDSDLALLYGVTTGALIQAVKRNRERFPDDFMQRLTLQEVRALISQNVTSNMGRGGRRSLPYIFTEQGVSMLSSVLKSKRAIQVNIQIMRTFSKIRQMLDAHKDLRQKIEAMEKKYDLQFKVVFDALKQLLEPAPQPEKPKRRIGFHRDLE
ncbi:MAG: ORF6N domain-containing protein [Candidatus Omnitrophica bacterium]|nr:ORF6N domain-containing protein [Candidatus Omnitrophota bacterium]